MSNMDNKILSGIFDSHFYDENHGAEIVLNNKKYLMFGSVNYLGLSHNPGVIEVAKKALELYGAGGLGSRASNGCLKIHKELDSYLAEFMGKESAISFNSGYLANLGVISSAIDHKAAIFSDKENHLSIYDACLLSGVETFRYKHNDYEHLEFFLKKTPLDREKWIVTVGTFGATGDIVNLSEIHKLAKKYKARIYLDDAHAIGIYGANRRGLAEQFGVIEDIDLIMGSFQMAFGNMGAFVAGNSSLIDQVRFHSRQYIFSYNLPALNVCALLRSLEIIRSKEGADLVDQLFENVESLRSNLVRKGLTVLSEKSQIISLLIGDDVLCVEFYKRIFEKGLWTQIYLNPSVPKDRAIIRLTSTAIHSREQIDRAADILISTAKELRIIK